MFPGRLGTEGSEGAIVGFLGEVFEESSLLTAFDVDGLSFDDMVFFEVLALVIFFFLFLAA